MYHGTELIQSLLHQLCWVFFYCRKPSRISQQDWILCKWHFKTSRSAFFKSASRCFILENWKIAAVVFVQLLSCVWLFATPWTVARQTPLSFTVSQSLLKYMSIESLMLYNHLISATLFYFCLQSFRWPKYWSLSISISSSSEYSGFISFRLTGLNSLQSRNSQESSLGPQLESISSSVLSLLYSPTLTSVHDY